MKDLISGAGALFAEFAEPEKARRAYTELRARGYRSLDSYSPFPITSEQAQGSGGWPPLAIAVFASGLLGGIAGYLIQWYANAYSYPLNIGGRPAHAVLAFIYPTFAAAVLFAGLTAFIGLLIALRLPRLWQPVMEIGGFEHVGIDRYWIVVGLDGGALDVDRSRTELNLLGAVRILDVAADS